MSLKDRYNRDGGGQGRVAVLDRHLTDLADRFGNWWQARTGVSRVSLTQALYLIAVWWATQHLLLFRNPTMVLLVGLALLGLAGKTASRGSVVEQMQLEVLGLRKNVFALGRLWLLGIGLLALANAAGLLGVALQGAPVLPAEIGERLLAGLALTALQAGEYIRRTNPFMPSGGGLWTR